MEIVAPIHDMTIVGRFAVTARPTRPSPTDRQLRHFAWRVRLAGSRLSAYGSIVSMVKSEVQLQNGMKSLQAGQYKDAERYFRKFLKVEPRHFGALNLLAVVLSATERFGEAEDAIERALRVDRTSDATFYNYGTILKHNGKLQQAIDAFDAALTLNPANYKALSNRGTVFAELGEHERAIADYDKALALQNGYVDAYYNKANALLALKRYKDAYRNFEKALLLNPRHAESFGNLVILFSEQGEYEKAIAFGRRAIALKPDFVDAYLNLAAAEAARSQFAAALRWLDMLASVAPQDPRGLAARALALKQLGRLEEAREAAERAAAIHPRDAEARADVQNALGSVLVEQGLFEEGIAAFDRAIALESASKEKAMLGRAAALETFGKGEEAAQAFDRILEVFPRSAGAWSGRAEHVKFAADDPAIAAMQALLAPDAPQTHADRMALNFALGKAFLDIGDSEAAFRHLGEGNRMKRAVTPYDAASHRKWFAGVAEAFSAELLERFADQGFRSSMPIFVVGMPRSGTTLIEQILASHPAVHGAGELNDIQRLAEQAGGMPGCAPLLDRARLARMGEDYVARVGALGQGKAHVVDKMPHNFLYAGLISLILPQAKIIHSRRDPVDTCLSCYTKLFVGALDFAYDLTELGRYHRDYQALMAHWRAVLPASHFLEVDYEAVVEDIEAEARRMLDFLGLPWDPACLEFHRTERPVLTASVNQVRQPIYRSSRGRWRKHAEHLGPLLQALEIEGTRGAAAPLSPRERGEAG